MNRGGNEVVVVEPRSFDDAATIVQHLKDRKIVMLNLHLLDKEQISKKQLILFVVLLKH